LPHGAAYRARSADEVIRPRAALTAIAVGLLLAACSGGASETVTTVAVTLTDKAVALDATAVPAGAVTFKVRNGGTIVHSLVLLKTDVPHDQIPADPNDAARVQQTGILRETGQLAVGETKQFAVRLAVGSYVLICNEPAHYLVGMHTPLTVR